MGVADRQCLAYQAGAFDSCPVGTGLPLEVFKGSQVRGSRTLMVAGDNLRLKASL